MLDDDELLQGFIEEAREHTSTIEESLLRLENDPEDMDIINLLFRSVHSIKGGAGFFGLSKMSSLAHKMENLFSLAREAKVVLNNEHIDALLIGFDKLNQMIDEPHLSEEMDTSENESKMEGFVKAVEDPDGGGKSDALVGTESASTGAFSAKLSISKNAIINSQSHGQNIFIIALAKEEGVLKKYPVLDGLLDYLKDFGSVIATNQEAIDPAYITIIFGSVMDSGLLLSSLELGERYINEVQPSALLEQMQSVNFANVTINSDSEKSTIDFEFADSEATQAPVTETPVSIEAPKEVKAEEAKPKVKAPKKAEPPKPKKAPPKSEENIRVSIGRLNRLVDLAGELVLARNQVLRLCSPLERDITGLNSVLANFNMVTTVMQEEIMNTRMQAVGTVFGKFPRVVRELANKLGKEIELVTKGNEVELDKSIIETLSDPLTHIVRNTADHGIESPEERKKAGKPIKGTLEMKAYHESGQVIILITDDGKGVDPDMMGKMAVEKGTITQEMADAMSDKEKVNLIFGAGFSTANSISSVSGRGVGMDVVKTNIINIGGSLDVNSTIGKGTSIEMTLPLTMAIVSCLIITSKEQNFAIPQTNLEELVMVKKEDYPKMLGKLQNNKILRLRGELLPLISFAYGLKIDDNPNFEDRETLQVLILKMGNMRVGVVVDTIIGSEEIVVKPMPNHLKNIKCFSGATILGDGSISLILDVPGFINFNKIQSNKDSGRSSKKRLAEPEHEEQSLLIFDIGSKERFAITIPLIQRVDVFEQEKIQFVGNKEYIDYRGEQMHILRLEDYLPVGKPESMEGEVCIIIPKNSKTPVGLLIKEVIDTKNLEINIQASNINEKGIIGSTIIDGHITLLLDLHEIMKMGDNLSIPKSGLGSEGIDKKKILLVEDTPFFLTVVSEYLKITGFDVTTAVNGKLALDVLNKQNFDLILTDIEMPQMDGWGLLKNIRANELYTGLPVIALTSLSDEKNIAAGKAAGFDDWLVKLDKEQVLERLHKYL